MNIYKYFLIKVIFINNLLKKKYKNIILIKIIKFKKIKKKKKIKKALLYTYLLFNNKSI